MLAENLQEVRAEIEAAARRAGRNPEDVLLLAVTKTHPVAVVREAIAAGLTELGENRVQELLEKQAQITDPVRWHLIGHLQTNKVKNVVGRVALIHSVESLRLAEEISRKAVALGVVQNVLVELNMAGEESKFGIKPEECRAFLRQIAPLPGLKVKGLMTVAPFVEDPERNRVYFRQMRELSVDIAAEKLDNVDMEHLSMGMSNDFAVAVEEGATIVRVGTRLFGERTYPV